MPYLVKVGRIISKNDGRLTYVSRAVLWELDRLERPRRALALMRFELDLDGTLLGHKLPALFLVRDAFPHVDDALPPNANAFFDAFLLAPFAPHGEMETLAALTGLQGRAILVRDSPELNLAYYTFPPSREEEQRLLERRELSSFANAADALLLKTRENWDEECASI